MRDIGQKEKGGSHVKLIPDGQDGVEMNEINTREYRGAGNSVTVRAVITVSRARPTDRRQQPVNG
jgi:hypothetical protein